MSTMTTNERCGHNFDIGIIINSCTNQFQHEQNL